MVPRSKSKHAFINGSCQAAAYLFIEFVDDSLRPLQMQLLTLQRPIDISQFDAHLAHQQSIVFIGPVDTGHAVIAHLERRARTGLHQNKPFQFPLPEWLMAGWLFVSQIKMVTFALNSAKKSKCFLRSVARMASMTKNRKRLNSTCSRFMRKLYSGRDKNRFHAEAAWWFSKTERSL